MKSTKLLLSLGLALSCLFGCSTEPNINNPTEEQTSETVQLSNFSTSNCGLILLTMSDFQPHT